MSINETERQILVKAVLDPATKPEVLIEVGTWLGEGSTLAILLALEQNGKGHLWGIEANPAVYEQMVRKLQTHVSGAGKRFTPLFGFSQDAIPRWLAERGANAKVDFLFLDGGNRPGEQITEFQLLNPHIPVGGQLLAHDAKLRKGKWLVPYLQRLDNWRTELHDVSDEGLFYARKLAVKPSPTSARAARTLLWRLRCDPVEVAAALLPSKVCALALKCLPRRLSWRLSDGRKSLPSRADETAT